uniref:Uncharacterized protein n=1 Tax=Human herpesvirus 1 TaxID=10298 RepID=A0A2Z4HB19_HHV1|nr:hypothetical protein [Human alphaherpesvirus 1]
MTPGVIKGASRGRGPRLGDEYQPNKIRRGASPIPEGVAR